MTGAFEAIIQVSFAVDTVCSMRACAFVTIDKVVTNSAIFAGIGIAIVDVEFTIRTLESAGTFTSIRADKIFTYRSILAWVGCTFINVSLAIATFKTRKANALMTVCSIICILTVSSILAKL